MTNYLQMSYKTWRDHWGYTQKEVAAVLGMTENAYAKIERGAVTPGAAVEELLHLLKIDHRIRLAKFGRQDPPPPMEVDDA